MSSTLASSFLLTFLAVQTRARFQPNPPDWPSGVYIFDPNDPTTAQSVIDEAFANNGGTNPNLNGQFSNERYAFLLKTGSHNINISLGYYTTVHGLGMLPTETLINSITVEDGSTEYTTGALDNFWRSAENFETTPSVYYNGLSEPTMLWAVSQSCPLRRAQINGGLSLYQYSGGCCAGYASGGFIGDIKVSTSIYAGSQQQFLVRNVEIPGVFKDGAWNIIFVGTTGTLPANNNTCYPYTSYSTTPIIAEKPFIYYNVTNGNYSLIVPHVEQNKVGAGTNWGVAGTYDTIDFSDVFVASPADTADTINVRLANGNHVLFAPGIYNLSESVVVSNDDTIILGIGMATLQCGVGSGDPCITVLEGVQGVRISGLLLEASNEAYKAATMLQMGPSTTGRNGHIERWHRRYGNLEKVRDREGVRRDRKDWRDLKDSNDSDAYEVIRDGVWNFVSDVFARVGGTNNVSEYQVSSQYMFEINMDDVIIDNTWLWRADHDTAGSVYNRSNPCQTGALVNGKNVIAYGLKVEHTLQDLVQWQGDYGATFFFQSELPYDVSQENFGDMGYVAYRVGDSVTQHEAFAVGVYCFFRDYDVVVESGIACPDTGTTFVTATTRYLSGNGGIKHIVNDLGVEVNSSNYQEYLCDYP